MLYLAWPPLHLNYLIFLGFVPLLMMENHIRNESAKPGSKVFFVSFFTFLLWNIFTTWWIWYASPGGAVLAILCNALLMCIPFMWFHFIQKRLAKKYAYIALCIFWMGFEYFHLNWDGNWPWLNLGNCWAGQPNWIQWYEYTGFEGGTLWIWIVNILIFEAIKNFKSDPKKSYKIISLSFIVIAFPIIFSYLIKPIPPKGELQNAVAVQPNIDPYQKFSGNAAQQLNTLIRLSESLIDTNTILLVWPETAITEEINESYINQFHSIIEIRTFLKKHPKIKLISGMNSYQEYTKETKSESAHLSVRTGIWYDIFNSGILMDSGQEVSVYHKSRLVPGVEVIPFEHALSFLGSFAINMGGGGGSLGTQKEPSVFKVSDKIVAAPVICYESIFGEYISQYVRKGANIITIFTNDGWWENTDGYKQHVMYAQLRAIEERMFIVRAANTGTSCFIQSDGSLQKTTAWWTEKAIKSPIVLKTKDTFYAQFGDLMGKISLYLGLGIYFIYFIFRVLARLFA